MAQGMPSHIGRYRIERELDRGGMGIVYLAHDQKLGRPAAIKALPEELSHHPDRLQRFEREAMILASLAHSNIVGIYGLEEAEGRRYLALEYIEGENLAQRLRRGPLHLQDAIDICLQIADGMEAAHERGIIHRDLKPANVIITAGDHVKVVDFGLAKGRLEDELPVLHQEGLSDSPTVTYVSRDTSPATMPGVVLGTAPYLSPEQARGKAVDRRADIWAFGCILYECLTGSMAFPGETASDAIAKILERDIDLSQLPKETPARLRELVRSCLVKDPRKRLRDMGDARRMLEQVKEAGPDIAATRSRPPWMGVLPLVTAVAGLALGYILWHHGTPSSTTQGQVVRLSVPIPPEMQLIESPSFQRSNGQPLLTPDGKTIIIRTREKGVDAAGTPPIYRLYARRLDQEQFQPLAGTQFAAATFIPTADSHSILYFCPVTHFGTSLRGFMASLEGEEPPTPVFPYNPDWFGRPAMLPSGDVLMSTNSGQAFVHITSGGEILAPQDIKIPGLKVAALSFSSCLPGGRSVLFNATWYEGNVYKFGAGVLDVATGNGKILIRDAWNPRYVPGDFLLFSRGTTLLGARFDPEAEEIRGKATALVNDLRLLTGYLSATFEVGADGTLLYMAGGDVSRERHAVTVNEDGTLSDWSSERQPFQNWFWTSPDGQRMAGVITNADAIDEIWVSERGHPTSRRVIAVPGVDCGQPMWTQDGRQMVFVQEARSDTDGVYVAQLDGLAKPRRVVAAPSGSAVVPYGWWPGGSKLLVTVTGAGDLGSGKGRAAANEWLATVPFASNSGNPRLEPLFSENFGTSNGAVSPNGRLFAYISRETGRYEVYVREIGSNGSLGEPLPASVGGAYGPVIWAPSGKQLYYMALGTSKCMVTEIRQEPRLAASDPKVKCDLRLLGCVSSFDILPDGHLLTIKQGENEENVDQLEVVLNFDQEVKAKIPN